MTTKAMSRRHLLALIGKNLGAAAMMQGMGTLGFAATSTYAGRSDSMAHPKEREFSCSAQAWPASSRPLS